MKMIHIIPRNDTKEHEIKKECWCKPELIDGSKSDAPGIFTCGWYCRHNDSREIKRLAKRKAEGYFWLLVWSLFFVSFALFSFVPLSTWQAALSQGVGCFTGCWLGVFLARRIFK